jgi:predicted RNase H-related nuclease YkuK (DUF458 family)
MKWKRLQTGFIEQPIVEYLEKLIESGLAEGKKLRICVGTDSQRHGSGYKYATNIIILTEGGGGIIIFSTEFIKGKITINERMLKEVEKSIAVAYEIYPLLDLYGIKLEVHADINTNPMHESNKALKMAVGYIQGMGYEFKVKPFSFASSNCADKLCK